MTPFEQKLRTALQDRGNPSILQEMKNFIHTYGVAVETSHSSVDTAVTLFINFFSYIEKNRKNPPAFEPFHLRIRAPFDHYQLGLNFVRPLINFSSSSLQGKNELVAILEALQRGENVILFANHQTEIDPQIISLLLEKEFPSLAEEMIFVAGHRVVTDPLAIPFSLGRNLFCIYSKKYLDTPPEKKIEKIQHNQRTLKVMEEKLREGGKCIYIAPSGGRDRMGEDGSIHVAPFDPASIEMLYLISKKAETKTHFHPLALVTYALLPPPTAINQEIGEMRSTQYAPVHLFFGEKIDLDNLGNDIADKKERRIFRAQYIWKMVTLLYDTLCSK